jgi:hypothetical protein
MLHLYLIIGEKKLFWFDFIDKPSITGRVCTGKIVARKTVLHFLMYML